MDGYGRELRVFLVDDHDIVRRGLRDLLMAHRDIFLVGDSGSARQAREVVPRLRPDVVVLDLHLQDGTGIDVCRAIRAADPSIRSVLLSASTDEEASTAVVLAGASGHVAKLAQSDAIVTAVRRAASGRPLTAPDDLERTRQVIRDRAETMDPPLSPRQRELLALVLQDRTDPEIAVHVGGLDEEVGAEVSEVVRRVSESV